MSSSGTIDLAAVAARLADRASNRAEATVQSDLRLLLLAAGLNLVDDNLEEVILEAPVGKRRRIDVEVGATVFEVKRDLRVGNVRADAVLQLAGYVRDRIHQTGSRYSGVLTDGAEWMLYTADGSDLICASVFELNSPEQVDDLCIWLDGILATTADLIPSPDEILSRLGAGSSANALDVAELTRLFRVNRNHPGMRMKRELWAKLLTTALGTAFTDEDSLFIEHTLLVVTAEIIAHAVVGYNPTDRSISAATLVRGQLFQAAQIRGVVEEDFFDWVVEVDGGASFVRSLAHHLARFRWEDVEHDVMKILYESVIGAETRKSLGEYYTPDWLAKSIVKDAVVSPLTQRVLDPSCGSGTFLFHAVRAFLDAADDANLSIDDAIRRLTHSVIGLDVHPVAVTLARVTYLLAMGRRRFANPDRPAFSVPVYLGDSIQWGQETNLLDSDALVVSTGDGATLFSDELRFPDRIVEDAATFDGIVAELAESAARPNRPSAQTILRGIFFRYAVKDVDKDTLSRTFQTMCDLHDTGRDHIWGYYVRNLARPLWLAREGNRVDVLIGNPPWLSYRFMPESTKADFRGMSEERGFWTGAADSPHQDLSALFVARAVSQYLRTGGRFSFVMPLAALSRRHFTGFRSGAWGVGSTVGETDVQFDVPWDLHGVKPAFFPVPAAVVSGVRGRPAVPLPSRPQTWKGRLAARNPTLEQAQNVITIVPPSDSAEVGPERISPYGDRFIQGAALAPRVLVFVREESAGPLGAGAGRVNIRSHRSANEKRPYRDLPDQTGSVERQFVFPALVGDSVLPFREHQSSRVVIPWDGGVSLEETVVRRLDQYPGMANWWRAADELWRSNRSSTNKLELYEQFDYRRKLSLQFYGSRHKVLYSKSGMYLAAAYVDNPRVIVDQSLYWAAVSGPEEGRYLTAVLNSGAVLRLIRPLQSRGEHNPRHFAGLVWRLPIPDFDDDSDLHRHLAQLAQRAGRVAGRVELPNLSFQALRRRVRDALVADGVADEIDAAVDDLLSS